MQLLVRIAHLTIESMLTNIKAAEPLYPQRFALFDAVGMVEQDVAPR